MEELKLFINAFKSEQPENCISVFFSRRITSNDISKYSTHQPSVSPQVQNDIHKLMLSSILSSSSSVNSGNPFLLRPSLASLIK